MTDATPAPEPVRYRLEQGEMAGYRWARPGAPRLVFAHANGFNAFTYRRLLAPLAQHYDVIAVDLRGHGRTTLPIDPQAHRSWQIHARDLAALIGQFDARPTLLAGHSMGATSMVMACEHLPHEPARLALIEPVIMPPAIYGVMHTPLGPAFSARLSIVKTALARKDGWDSPQAVQERYAAKPAFSRWAPGVLDDYLADGLVERDGEWRLACPPAWEAANYGAQRNRPLAAARALDAPLAVLMAGRGTTVRDPKGLLAAGAVITERAEAGHLIAMENPAFTGEWLAAQCETAFGPGGAER